MIPSFRISALLLIALNAHAETVLISPSDSVRNGGFEASAPSSGASFANIPFWDSYFPEGQTGGGTTALHATNARTGNNRIAVNGWSGEGIRLHPSQIIPASAWTIEAGDTFRFTAFARSGTGFDIGSDSLQLILHVVDPVNEAPVPTASGNADRLLDHNAPASLFMEGIYTEVVRTSAPVPTGSPWIGKILRPRLLVNGERAEFAMVDDVELIAYRETNQNPPAVLVSSYEANGDTTNAGPGTQPGVADAGLLYGPGFGIGKSFATAAGGVTLPFAPDGAFSLTFWMKTETAGLEGGDLRWFDGSALIDASATPNTGWGVSLRGSKIAAGDESRLIASQGIVTDGRWHHVALTRSTNGTLSLFLDGSLQDSAIGTAILTTAPDAKIGTSRFDTRHFDGLMDDIRLFTGVLTSAEINDIRIGPGDSDADGFPNVKEEAAGTDWGDASDFPRALSIAKDADGVRVEVDGKRSRQYQLERRADPSAPPGTIPDAVAPLEADTPSLELIDPSPPADRAFYRVRSEKGPLPKPNILLIVGDDHGYADISAYPNARPDVSTPHFDRIAAAGSLLTQAYVTSPVCSPSRCGYLTGRMQNEWDAEGGWAPRLPVGVKHLAEYLKEAGYATAMIGKNDFGQPTGSINNRDHPTNHGFDRFFGFNAHAHDFFLHSQAITDSVIPAWPTDASAHLGKFINTQVAGNFETINERIWQTELFTDRAISYMQERAEVEDPFFLYLSHASVHALIHQVPKSYLDAEGVQEIPDYDPFTNTSLNPASYTNYYYRASRPKPQDANGFIADADMRKYYRAHLRAYDDQIGRLLDSLASLGLAENTIIIYFSDNGGEALTGANNQPLSGSKYTVFEGGLRVPMMVSWPGRIPAGQTYEHVVSALDVVPTLLDVAGIGVAPKLRGQSLIEPLKNNSPVVPGERILYWRFNNQWAIRKGDWKLVNGQKNLADKATSQIVFNEAVIGKTALFNLADDPAEMNDLAESTNPEIQGIKADLQKRYDAWNSSNG